MILWLDAGSHNTVHQVGGDIYQWDDRSGHGYNATQATAAKQPVYVPFGLNGRNVVRFNGLTEYMNFPNIGSYSNVTVFMVFKYTIDPVNYESYIISKNNYVDGAVHCGIIGDGVTFKLGEYLSNSVKTELVEGSTTVANTAYIGTIVNTLNTVKFWRNGIFYGNVPTTVNVNRIYGPGKIGIRGDEFGYWNGDIGEILIYQGELTDAEREAVQNCLSYKWNIPVEDYSSSSSSSLADSSSSSYSMSSLSSRSSGSSSYSSLSSSSNSSSSSDSSSSNSSSSSSLSTSSSKSSNSSSSSSSSSESSSSSSKSSASSASSESSSSSKSSRSSESSSRSQSSESTSSSSSSSSTSSSVSSESSSSSSSKSSYSSKSSASSASSSSSSSSRSQSSLSSLSTSSSTSSSSKSLSSYSSKSSLSSYSSGSDSSSSSESSVSSESSSSSSYSSASSQSSFSSSSESSSSNSSSTSSSTSSSSSTEARTSSSSSSSSSTYILSPFNELAIYQQGYIKNQVGGVLVGKHQLFDKRIANITGICTDPSGNIFVTDPTQHVVVKITPAGVSYVYAGQLGKRGNNGGAKVQADSALFNEPMGLNSDSNGNVYVADKNNNQVRMITPDRYVYLIVGSPTGASGFKSGKGFSALFNQPNDIAVNKSGNIYVADMGNHAVRLIRQGTATVITVAGNGVAGDGYGLGINARLNSPYSVACDPSGKVYICDSGNYKIKILDGNFNVLRFSGSGNRGNKIGNATVCEFNDLKFSDIDRTGNMFVIDFIESGNSRMLRINQNGASAIVKDFAHSVDDRYAVGVATQSSTDLFFYVTESAYEISQYSSSSSSSTEVRSSSSSSSLSESSSSSSSSSSSESSESSSSSSYSSSSSSSSSSLSSLSSSSSSLNDYAKITENGNPRITENGWYLFHD